MEQRPNRIFHATSDTTVIPDVDAHLRRLASNERSLVVGVHGYAEGTKPHAKCAVGVYFGLDSSWNISAPIPQGYAEDSQAAHLYAATVALEMLQGSKLLAGRNTIILQVDASYTSVFLSELVWIWDQRGYKNHAGKQLSFTEVAQDLHGICSELENTGAQVKIWRVKHGGNIDAANLARAAVHARPIEDLRKRSEEATAKFVLEFFS